MSIVERPTSIRQLPISFEVTSAILGVKRRCGAIMIMAKARYSLAPHPLLNWGLSPS